jgi:hypothetical protein
MVSRSLCKKRVFVRSAPIRGFSSGLGNSLAAVVFVTAIGLLLSGVNSASAIVITDDFSDMNDTANPAWTHLDGAVQSTGQMWDASTGQYHLTAPSNGTAPGLEGFGFVGSYIGTPFRDVRVSVDVVDFPNVGELGSNFALMARNNGNNNPLLQDFENTFHAYGYEYQPAEAESNPPGESGEMVLTLGWAGGVSDIGSQKVRLDNGKDYRFVLEVVGSTLHGQVFNLTDGGILVGERFRDLISQPVMLDHDNNNTTPDIQHVPYMEGFSGMYAYGYIIASDANVTFDNFRTETLVAGDYNGNGVTDAADYVIWRKTVGQMGPVGNCDPNNTCTGNPIVFGNMQANGAVSSSYTQTIDAADYEFWRANFGKTVSESGVGAGAAVPEPTAALIVLLAAATMACYLRRSA